MQWLILGGCPRSGTTGLMDSLNQDPRIGLIPEYDSARLFKMADAFFFKEANVKRKSWVGDINLNVRGDATVLTKKFLKYVPQKAEARDRIIETLFKTTFGPDCVLHGEKFPMYWKIDLDFVIESTTRLQIIQILRNPKPVIRSYLHRRWLKTNDRDIWPFMQPADGFRHWILAWEALERNRDRERLELLPVKYEDLLASDRPYGEIGEFLGIDELQYERLVAGQVREDTNVEVTFEFDREIETVFGGLLEDWGDPIPDLLARYPSRVLRANFEEVFKEPFEVVGSGKTAKGDLLDRLVSRTGAYRKQAPRSFSKFLVKRLHRLLKSLNGWRRGPTQSPFHQ